MSLASAWDWSKRRSPLARLTRLILRRPSEIETLVAGADLPEPCADLVRAVVRRTRLWPGERADVALELIDHMRDALAAEREPAEIIESFGDPAPAARLIRRARKRQRHPLLKAWTLAVRITIVSPLILFAVYALLTARFYMGDPTITTNYIALLNAERPEAGPGRPPYETYQLATERWRDVTNAFTERISEHPRSDGNLASVITDIPHVPKDDEEFAAIEAAFRAFAPNLDDIEQAARHPGHGMPLVQDIEYPDQELPADERLYSIVEMPDDPGHQTPLWGVLLPHLGSIRTCAKLTAFDLRLAVIDNDSERASQRLRTLTSLANQASNDGFMISNLVAQSIHSLACHELGRVLRDEPGFFTEQQLVDLSHIYAAGAEQALDLAFLYERYMIEDMLQRTFTDNGRGNGRLTNECFALSARFGLNDFGPVPSTYNPNASTRLLAPVAALAVADRRSQHELTMDQIGLAEQALMRGPSAMPELIAARRRLDQKFDTIFMRWRYLMVANFVGGLSQAVESTFECRALSEAARVAIASELYRRDTGDSPTTLDALIPRYLPAAPEDPYDPGHTLRLLDTETGIVIYSVGQNARDDGGTPMLDRQDRRVNHSLETRYDAEASAHPTRRTPGLPPPSSDTTGTGDWVLFPPND